MKSMREREIPINTPISIFGTNMRVVKKVTYQMIESCFSIFQALLSGLKRTMCETATMMIAASVAIGRWARKGVKNNSVHQTISHVITDVKPVVAQAFKFTAVLEKLPATPYPPKKLDDRFASHCHISSLFGESGFLVVYEINFATEMDSVKPISQITTENIQSLKIFKKSSCDILICKKFNEKLGRSDGICCTIFPQ